MKLDKFHLILIGVLVATAAYAIHKHMEAEKAKNEADDAKGKVPVKLTPAQEAAQITSNINKFSADQRPVMNSYKAWLLKNPNATSEEINTYITGTLTPRYGKTLVNATMDEWNNL